MQVVLLQLIVLLASAIMRQLAKMMLLQLVLTARPLLLRASLLALVPQLLVQIAFPSVPEI